MRYLLIFLPLAIFACNSSNEEAVAVYPEPLSGVSDVSITGRISVDFAGHSLRSAVQTVSSYTNRSYLFVVPGVDLDRKVDMKIEANSWDEVLDALLSARGLKRSSDGRILPAE